jgi:hypothetical protein
LTRREFLKLTSVPAGATLIPKGHNREVPQTVETPDHPWEEASPLTKAGAEYLGSIKEEVDGERINEIRGQRLPFNPAFPGFTLLAINSRLYPKGYEDDDDAVAEWGGMRILIIPDQVEPTPQLKKHDKTLRFGNIRLDIDQKTKGQTNIWETDFYYKSMKLKNIDNTGDYSTDVEHLGHSKIYWDRVVFFTDDSFHILTPQGPVTKKQKALLFEADYGEWTSVPIPNDLTDRELSDITVARNEDLYLVKGLTEEPFCMISRPTIRDGQPWNISFGEKTIDLSTTTEFMGKVSGLTMQVEVAPENMTLLKQSVENLKKMWGDVTVNGFTRRKLPFFSAQSGDNYLGKPVAETEYNPYVIVTEDSYEFRESVIAVNPDRVKIEPQPLRPRVETGNA